MDIVKASGEKESFRHDKLCTSLKRTGAPARVVQKVCGLVEKELQPNSSTEQIEKKTATYLARENLLLAAKYRLRSAIMELGPAGFFFEEYIAAVLREYGYKTTVGTMLKGHCLSHEIDILAEKDNVHHIMELKYHNRRGLRTDVQVAMYTYARFLDIAAAHRKFEARLVARQAKKHKAWVVTNTKFTTSAIKYAQCMDVQLLGWYHPQKESLEELIELRSLYPITVLPSANAFVKAQCAAKQLMFVRDILHYSPRELMKLCGLHENIASRLVREAYSLV